MVHSPDRLNAKGTAVSLHDCDADTAESLFASCLIWPTRLLPQPIMSWRLISSWGVWICRFKIADGLKKLKVSRFYLLLVWVGFFRFVGELAEQNPLLLSCWFMQCGIRSPTNCQSVSWGNLTETAIFNVYLLVLQSKTMKCRETLGKKATQQCLNYLFLINLE